MTKRFFVLRILVAVMLVSQLMPSLAHGAPVQELANININESELQQALQSTAPIKAIIELESAPMIAHKDRLVSRVARQQRMSFESAEAADVENSLRAEQENFKTRALSIVPALQVRTEMRALANAISVEARGTDVAALAALPGVKSVELVRQYHKMLSTSVPLINAPAMWEHLGGQSNAGSGVRIAILDTGIDITNPLFNDAGYTAPSGFPRFNNGSQSLTNNKVIVAKSFISDSSSSSTALDEEGHGSNVAGIAAGDTGTLSPLGSISGVAPHAFLGNYRVLGKDGSGATDLIADALEEAVRDGFDVANMSLGSTSNGTLDFLARTVESATDAGMVVAIAAGNSGTGGSGDDMTVGTPGIAPSAITVASVSNAHFVSAVAMVTGPAPVPANLTSIPMVAGAGSSQQFDNGDVNLPLASVPKSRGCKAIAASSLTGRVALIERGNCNFSDKVNNAAAAGAKAVIVYNQDISESDSGGDTLVGMQVDGTTIPSAFVTRTSGLALLAFLKAHADAALSFAPLFAGSQTSDVVSIFSSRGPSALEGLKPDIAAPGENIYSADLRTNDPSGFSAVEGTSQATPHVAGSAALVIQLHPDWSPAQVKSALMSSATESVFTTSAKTARSGVLATGAGRVDLGQAATVSATFEPASLSFGILALKKQPVATNLSFTITNASGNPGTFTFSVQQLDPGDGFSATLTSPASVTLNAGQSATATLAINAAKAAAKRDYTGFVNVVDPQGQTLHVPFWVRFVKKKK